jgi:hypothetical protein
MVGGVTLETIGGGALAELFARALSEVLANIADPNTDPKSKRAIAMSVSFKPKSDRATADVQLTCVSKLAGVATVDTRLFLGRQKGKLVAVEDDPRQGSFFDQPAAPGPVAVGDFGAERTTS